MVGLEMTEIQVSLFGGREILSNIIEGRSERHRCPRIFSKGEHSFNAIFIKDIYK